MERERNINIEAGGCTLIVLAIILAFTICCVAASCSDAFRPACHNEDAS